MKLYLIGVVLLSCLLTFHSCDHHHHHHHHAKTITTPLGEIKGNRINVLGKTVDQYLGIPFTKPLSKETRYKKAELIDVYETTIEAYTMPPDCPQIIFEEVEANYEGLYGTRQDENCLFLNIWHPICESDNNTAKPVMFWIYGGGFQIGSVSEAYNGKIISAFGDVIVVSANYRVGSFGYLTSATEEEPGNLGLYDQNLALQWVHDNIASFGGDPSQVTVFGQEAGGFSITAHMLSGKSDGLFKRAILQSGAYLTPIYKNSSQILIDNALKLAQKVQCASENDIFESNKDNIMTCLRNTSIESLLEAEKSLEHCSFLPHFGEEFLMIDDIKNFPAHFNKDVEVMIGVAEEEGNVILLFQGFDKEFTDPEKMMKKTETQNFATDFLRRFFHHPENLTKPYFENIEEDDVIGARTAFSNIQSDMYFHCPSIIFSDAYADKGGLVKFYMLTYYSLRHTPLPDWMHATSFTDVPFIFGEPLKPNSTFSNLDADFSRYIMTTWTNFAKGGEHQEWSAYTPNSNTAFELHTERNATVEIPRAQFCYDIWKPAFEQELELLVH